MQIHLYKRRSATSSGTVGALIADAVIAPVKKITIYPDGYMSIEHTDPLHKEIQVLTSYATMTEKERTASGVDNKEIPQFFGGWVDTKNRLWTAASVSTEFALEAEEKGVDGKKFVSAADHTAAAAGGSGGSRSPTTTGIPIAPKKSLVIGPVNVGVVEF